jgi:hypothetical protein
MPGPDDDELCIRAVAREVSAVARIRHERSAATSHRQVARH